MKTIQICFRCAESPAVGSYQLEGAVSHYTTFITDWAVMMAAGPFSREKFIANLYHFNSSLGWLTTTEILDFLNHFH